MTPDLVIGLDSSTTATKAIAFDAAGRAVAEGRATMPLSNPQAGWFEQEVEEWWRAAAASLSAVTSAVDVRRIAAVAISNQRESYAYFDRDGHALRPGTLWLDERSRPQVASLPARIGAERIHAISGKPPDLTPCLYRFAWFAENMPAIPERAAMAAEVHGALTHRLTGHWRTSIASADPMGLLDMAHGAWSAELIEAVGFSVDRLPSLFRPGETTGCITAEAARATGLLAGTPLIAGGGDGQCAGTGSNVLVPGRAYVNLGTAVVSGNYDTVYAHHRAFRTMNAIAEQGFIFESCLRTGTFLVDWLVRELFNVDPKTQPGIFRELEVEAAKSPIGANGVTVVPYWSGCMTPYWDAGARGIVAGLTSSHRRGDVYRGLLEGIALEQAMGTRAISAVSRVPIDHYVAIGGGSSSDLWCQILADASGLPVMRSNTAEASALGAACAAAKGAGWFGSIADAANAMAGHLTGRFDPNPAAQGRYAELLAIYRDLWPALTAWNARLAAFAGGGAR